MWRHNLVFCLLIDPIAFGNDCKLALPTLTMKTPLCVHFSQDSQYLLTGSERHFPTVWDLSDGHILYTLAQQRPEDLATPWLQLACNDRWLVGLTMTAETKETYPHMYSLQVWSYWHRKIVMLIEYLSPDSRSHLPLVPHMCVSESGKHWLR